MSHTNADRLLCDFVLVGNSEKDLNPLGETRDRGSLVVDMMRCVCAPVTIHFCSSSS